jgi:hypothetical protein
VSGKELKPPPEPTGGIQASKLKKLERTLGVPESLASQVGRTLNLDQSRFFGVSSSVEKMMREAAAPSLEIQRMMRELAAPSLEIQKTMRALAAPSLEIQKMMRALAAPSLEIQKTMRALAAPSLEIQETMRVLAAPSLEIQKMMREATAPFLEIQKMMRGAAAAPSLNIQKMMAELRANSAMTFLSAESFASNNTLDLTSIPEVVLGVVERNLREAGVEIATQTEQVAPAAENIQVDWPWERRLKKEPEYVQYIVWILLFFLIHPIVEGFFHALAERWLNSDSAQARTQISIEVRQNFGADRLAPLRCAKRAIDVREAPSTTSQVTGRLSADQPVEVLETRGPFSLIRYRDPVNGETREGWAASGFLVKSRC